MKPIFLLLSACAIFWMPLHSAVESHSGHTTSELAENAGIHEDTQNSAADAERPSPEDFEPYQLVVVVNEQNPLNTLTTQQIQLLFSRDAADWGTIRDDREQTRVYAPGPLNEAHGAFISLGLEGREFGPDVMLYDDASMILAKVSKDKRAMGLVKYPFTRTEGVKVIAVGGLSPLVQNYPYQVTYDVLYPEVESEHVTGHAHWSYSGSTGPEHWGDLSPEFILCKTGKRQSPIDLVNPDEKAGEPLEFRYQPAPLDLVNNGHTLQQNFAPGSVVVYQDKEFELKQLHFHSQSEHTLNGAYSSLEMHLVHRAEDGELLVVGVLFNRGAVSPLLNTILSYAPQQSGETYSSGTVKLDIEKALPENRTVYSYSGSLTTPPGTEGVNWFVFAEPKTISPVQLVSFQKLYKGNYRPIQPTNDRALILYKP